MSDPFATVATELPRDRWGRPLITPPEGGEPIAYQRVTTFVGALEDTFHLGQWQMRMVALGMARTKSLQLAASAITDPKDKSQKRTLNGIAKDALNMANGSAAADTGTALHTFTEEIDAGRPLQYVPEEYEADLDAYREIVAPFDIIEAEGFCVRDDLRVGGSYDRLVSVKGAPLIAPDGEEVTGAVWDLKTGGSHEAGLFGIGKIACQLGVYRNSQKYDHTLGSRTDLPAHLSKRWGIICHLPAGTGRASLLWVDIAAGWDIAYRVIPEVHAWRKRKDLSKPFATASASPVSVPLPEQIRNAATYADLLALHAAHALVWTPGLTALAAQRKKELAA